MAKQAATFVSVWDGSVEVRTNCFIDLAHEIPFVSDVESVEVTEDYSTLDEEYIELNGEKITTFQDDEENLYEDGQRLYLEDIDSDSKLYRILTNKAD
jgi:hypothetical protein